MQIADYIITSNDEGISEIRTDKIKGKRSLFSNKNFEAGDIISNFYWDEIFEQPNYLTIQVGDNKHIILKPTYLECINHSCEPNVFFDTTKNQLICLFALKAGDEFTFFYPSAEWDMDQSFECLCGAKTCIGFVRGAKYLSENDIKKYKFTDYILQKLSTK